MERIKYFRPKEQTNRFSEGQKVWIVLDLGNGYTIYHKWRGSGRYVFGEIAKDSPYIGEVKEMEIPKSFIERMNNKRFNQRNKQCKKN